MYTGEGDPYKLATIQSYNGVEEMDHWNGSECNKVIFRKSATHVNQNDIRCMVPTVQLSTLTSRRAKPCGSSTTSFVARCRSSLIKLFSTRGSQDWGVHKNIIIVFCFYVCMYNCILQVQTSRRCLHVIDKILRVSSINFCLVSFSYVEGGHLPKSECCQSEAGMWKILILKVYRNDL